MRKCELVTYDGEQHQRPFPQRYLIFNGRLGHNASSGKIEGID